MEFLSTQGLPKAGRAAAWGAIYATRMSQVEFTPGDQSKFDAELRIGQLGPIKLARLSLDNCSVERTNNHIARNSPRLYNFLLQAEGASTFYHCGKEAKLETGDFVLCDTGLPHYWRTDQSSVTVMVRVPGEVLRTYLPTPEQYCGRHLGRATGLTGTVATMVRELSERAGGAIAPVYEDRVARYLLEMISMSYAMGMEPEQDASAIAWQRRKDVIEFIEDNLRDPDLSPATISEGLRVSPRYLRTVFAPGGEKMSAYILRRRLEQCARQMCTPAWKAHTLTEIAFSWGFNSAAHFTRTFHEKYGMAPREYRKQGLAQAVAA
jgi:AraC-like DNA-binding protein